MNDKIKKWVRRAGLELVSLELQPNIDPTVTSPWAMVTVKIPGDAEFGAVALDLAKLEAASERAAESLLAYEFERICGALHVAWHLRGIKTVEPDAALLELGAPCRCGGKRIVYIDLRAHVYRCERDIEHVFPRVTVIPHDGLVAVLYEDVPL